LKITKIIQSLNLTDAIIDDICSIVHVTYPTNTVHADSLHKTLPLLCFHLAIAKITQSLNLTDATTDDSY